MTTHTLSLPSILSILSFLSLLPTPLTNTQLAINPQGISFYDESTDYFSELFSYEQSFLYTDPLTESSDTLSVNLNKALQKEIFTSYKNLNQGETIQDNTHKRILFTLQNFPSLLPFFPSYHSIHKYKGINEDVFFLRDDIYDWRNLLQKDSLSLLTILLSLQKHSETADYCAAELQRAECDAIERNYPALCLAGGRERGRLGKDCRAHLERSLVWHCLGDMETHCEREMGRARFPFEVRYSKIEGCLKEKPVSATCRDKYDDMTTMLYYIDSLPESMSDVLEYVRQKEQEGDTEGQGGQGGQVEETGETGGNRVGEVRRERPEGQERIVVMDKENVHVRIGTVGKREEGGPVVVLGGDFLEKGRGRVGREVEIDEWEMMGTICLVGLGIVICGFIGLVVIVSNRRVIIYFQTRFGPHRNYQSKKEKLDKEDENLEYSLTDMREILWEYYGVMGLSWAEKLVLLAGLARNSVFMMVDRLLRGGSKTSHGQSSLSRSGYHRVPRENGIVLGSVSGDEE